VEQILCFRLAFVQEERPRRSDIILGNIRISSSLEEFVAQALRVSTLVGSSGDDAMTKSLAKDAFASFVTPKSH